MKYYNHYVCPIPKMHFDANINRIVIENKDGYLYVNKYKIIEHVATGSFCKVYKVIA